MDDWQRWRRVLAGEPLPALLVDLDAMEENVRVIRARLGEQRTLRVATKSLRIPAVVQRILDAGGSAFQGLLCYAAHEAALLSEHGFDDLLVAYPFARPDEVSVVVRLCAGGARVIPTVDDAVQVDMIADAARSHDVVVGLCMDVDLSWRPLGGRAHLGVRRSPIRTARAALTLARRIADTPGVELRAVLAYEAQIAGIPDRNPGSRYLDPVRQAIKRRSMPAAMALRREVVDELRAAGHPISVVNGGGTGSVAFTSADPAVTEVSAGSGFLCSHLFDGYADLPLRPACFIALAVCRCSDPDHVTCAGGGYLASGAPGPDRAPRVYLPEGLEPLGLEGWGEVQTPLRWRGSGRPPVLGDPVLCRHAKAGEPAERFTTALLVRGEEIVERAPTTDTYTLPQSQEEFYFALPYDRMDRMLYAYNQEMSPEEAARHEGLTAEQAARVFADIAQKRRSTRYLHLAPRLVEEVPLGDASPVDARPRRRVSPARDARVQSAASVSTSSGAGS